MNNHPTRDSYRARRICFDTHKHLGPLGRWFLTCHICNSEIDALYDSKRWRADHIRRHAEGGEDTPENLYPICLDCDCGPNGKAARDTKDVAKGKRVHGNHFGLNRKRSKLSKQPGMKFNWSLGRYEKTER